MSLDRVLLVVAAAALMSGCHLFGKLTPDCHTPQEYQRAGQVAPLKVPTGLDSPNTQGALVIPVVLLAPQTTGKNDGGIEISAPYSHAPPNNAPTLARPAPPRPELMSFPPVR